MPPVERVEARKVSPPPEKRPATLNDVAAQLYEIRKLAEDRSRGRRASVGTYALSGLGMLGLAGLMAVGTAALHPYLESLTLSAPLAGITGLVLLVVARAKQLEG